MIAILSGLWAKVGSWVAAAGAAVVAVGSVLLMARSSGITAQQAADSKTELKETTEAQDVQNQVAATTPDAQRDELRQWSR